MFFFLLVILIMPVFFLLLAIGPNKKAKYLINHLMESRMAIYVNIIKKRGVSRQEEFLDTLVNL